MWLDEVPDLVAMSATCKDLWNIVQSNPQLWKELYQQYFGLLDLYEDPDHSQLPAGVEVDWKKKFKWAYKCRDNFQKGKYNVTSASFDVSEPPKRTFIKGKTVYFGFTFAIPQTKAVPASLDLETKKKQWKTVHWISGFDRINELFQTYTPDTVKFLDWNTGQEKMQIRWKSEDFSKVECFCWSSQMFACATASKIRVWDLTTGAEYCTIKAPSTPAKFLLSKDLVMCVTARISLEIYDKHGNFLSSHKAPVSTKEKSPSLVAKSDAVIVCADESFTGFLYWNNLTYVWKHVEAKAKFGEVHVATAQA